MKEANISELIWCDASSMVTNISNIMRLIQLKKNLCEIHVGCDSHFIKEECVFALVIALYEPGKGGTYFFARNKMPRSKSRNMKMRLLKETEKAISIADYIRLNIGLDDIHVHLDINPNKKYKSSQVFTSATSLVKSQGYNCIVKPDAWASSWLADAYSK